MGGKRYHVEREAIHVFGLWERRDFSDKIKQAKMCIHDLSVLRISYGHLKERRYLNGIAFYICVTIFLLTNGYYSPIDSVL